MFPPVIHPPRCSIRSSVQRLACALYRLLARRGKVDSLVNLTAVPPAAWVCHDIGPAAEQRIVARFSADVLSWSKPTPGIAVREA